ncbi:flagellin [Clostridia bacterium]|nr:flagellin [Clostridia bacterium]
MSNTVVQTNVLALNAHRNMKTVGVLQSRSSQKLSSGYKINSAADDAAGLAISEKMRSQIRGLDMASKNSQDAQSLVQTAEGGLQEIDNMVQRIRELVVYASNDTNEQTDSALDTGDRQKIQDEIDQLTSEIDSMSSRVEFNKKKLVNGDAVDDDARLGQIAAKVTQNESNFTTSATKAADYVTTLTDGGAGAPIAGYDKLDAQIAAAGISTLTEYLTDKTTVPDVQAGEAGAKIDYATIISAAATDTAQMASFEQIEHINGVLDAVNAWEAAVKEGGVKLSKEEAEALDGLKAELSNMADMARANKALTDEEAAITKRQTGVTGTPGKVNNGLYFQIGANAGQGMQLSINKIKSDTLGIGNGAGQSTIDVRQETGFETTNILTTLDRALTTVTTERAKLGAAYNRLDYTMKSLDTSSENLSAAESRIRDTDMAKEMMNLTKANVLQQSSVSMLAQANQNPQSVLRLLG